MGDEFFVGRGWIACDQLGSIVDNVSVAEQAAADFPRGSGGGGVIRRGLPTGDPGHGWGGDSRVQITPLVTALDDRGDRFCGRGRLQRQSEEEKGAEWAPSNQGDFFHGELRESRNLQ